MDKPIPFQRGQHINLSLLKKQIDRRILKITRMVYTNNKPNQQTKTCADKCCQLTNSFTQTQSQQIYQSQALRPLEEINCNNMNIYNNNSNAQQMSSPIACKKIISKSKNKKSSLYSQSQKENKQNAQILYQQLSFKKSPDRIKISMIINSLPQTRKQQQQMESPSISKDFICLNNSIENTSILGSNEGEQFNRQDFEIQDDKFFSNCAVFEQLFEKVQGAQPCTITKNQFSQTQSVMKSNVKKSKVSLNKDLDLSSIHRQSIKRKRANSIHQNYKIQKKSIAVTQSFDKILISNECRQKMMRQFKQKSQKARKQCKGNNIRVSLLRRIEQKYIKGKERVDQY